MSADTVATTPSLARAPARARALGTAGALLILALFTWLAAEKQNLVTSDLGRHLANGALFLETGRALATNHYAYTAPDYPAPSHHWGAGVLFELVRRASGFTGLAIVHLAIQAAAVGLLGAFAWRRYGSLPALLSTFLALPLLTERTEIRPEALSALFLAASWWGLDVFRRTGSRRAVAALAILEIVWVNTHIFFVLGPALALAHAVPAPGRGAPGRRSWGVLFLLLAAACLVNPFTWRGALEPFTIFGEYGFAVAENEPLWRVQLRHPTWVNYLHFEALALAALAAVAAAWRISSPFARVQRLVLLGTAITGVVVLRALPLFGLVWIPVGSGLLAERLTNARRRRVAVGLAIVLFAAAPALGVRYYRPNPARAGIGLADGVQGAGAFLGRTQLSGPIFNNYDIGGYLIHHLFPRERVFVDNRPEAYPAAFFRDTYEPMLAEEERWREVDARYGFNAIVFHRHDRTTHGQPFLGRRLDDPAWAPVFVDAYVLILARRSARNREVIGRFELPRDLFRRVPNAGTPAAPAETN